MLATGSFADKADAPFQFCSFSIPTLLLLLCVSSFMKWICLNQSESPSSFKVEKLPSTENFLFLPFVSLGKTATAVQLCREREKVPREDFALFRPEFRKAGAKMEQC